METRHVAQRIQHLHRLPIVEHPKEIEGIGHREMRCLIKRETSQDCVEPVRKIACKRDFGRAGKKRSVKPNVIPERSVQRSMRKCRPKAQSEKRQHHSKKNAVLSPKTTNPRGEKLVHRKRRKL